MIFQWNGFYMAGNGWKECSLKLTTFHFLQVVRELVESGFSHFIDFNSTYRLRFIRAPFYVLLVFVVMCSVFWLFWLSCHYLPSDWLERPLWGSLIVVRGSSPESPGRRVRMIFLVYCIASLFYDVFVLSPDPTWHIFLLLWRDIAYLC